MLMMMFCGDYGVLLRISESTGHRKGINVNVLPLAGYKGKISDTIYIHTYINYYKMDISLILVNWLVIADCSVVVPQSILGHPCH